MFNAQQQFKQVLKEKDYSLTKPRLIVFNSLLKFGPINMHDLIDKTKAEIDRASAYRSVELFEKLGVSQRVYLGFKYKLELSELFEGHHHHFSCLNCGLLISINDYQLESYIDNLPSLSGAKVMTHQLEIQGLCQKCKSQNNN